MPFKIVVLSLRLREAPREDAANPAGLVQIGDLLEKVADAPAEGWWQVRVATPGSAPRTGFVRSEFLVEVDPPPLPEQIDKPAFFQLLRLEARNYATNREYLYAVAFLESGIRNVRSKHSAAFGPFQFMPATWRDLVTRFGAEDDVAEADITVPAKQARFAARYTSLAQQALVQRLDRIPSPAELYLGHLLGLTGAGAVLAASNANPVDVGLRKGTALSDAQVDAMLAANAGLLKIGTRVRTTDEVLDEVARRLEPGLAEAAALAALLGPPIGNTPSGQGTPPWLTVAQAELAKGIREAPAPASNPAIEAYLRSTTFGGTISDKVPWCAAFVSWCMENSGNATVAARNRRSAWVPDWRAWGFPVGRPVVGAVAIVSPQHDNTAGHIGIVTDEVDSNIVLLGGNQGDAVSQVRFAKTDVLDYRWLDF